MPTVLVAVRWRSMEPAMRRGVLTLYAILIVLAATFWFLLDH